MSRSIDIGDVDFQLSLSCLARLDFFFCPGIWKTGREEDMAGLCAVPKKLCDSTDRYVSFFRRFCQWRRQAGHIFDEELDFNSCVCSFTKGKTAVSRWLLVVQKRNHRLCCVGFAVQRSTIIVFHNSPSSPATQKLGNDVSALIQEPSSG